MCKYFETSVRWFPLCLNPAYWMWQHGPSYISLFLPCFWRLELVPLECFCPGELTHCLTLFAHTFPLPSSFSSPEHIMKYIRTKHVNFFNKQIPNKIHLHYYWDFWIPEVTVILWKEQFPKVQKYSTVTKPTHLNVTLNFWNLCHNCLSLLCFMTSGQRTCLFNVYIKM